MRTSGKKLVLFGAGKIGRSFIGQLFSRSGYEVVFVDISKTLIDELNRKRQSGYYQSDAGRIRADQNIRGVV
jgi:mannitol-1-phosphate 5-dehydrogenase